MHQYASRGLVYNVHPLPNGCEWVHANEIEERAAISITEQKPFKVGDRWYIIAKVETRNGYTGYSAGFPQTS